MTNMIRLSYKSAITVLVTLTMAGLCGCASSSAPPPDYSHLVWPPKPAKPRVKFVMSFQSNLDVEEMDFMEGLFGSSGASLVLSYPSGVASDGKGRIYVSDRFGTVVIDLIKRRMSKFAFDLRKPRGIAVSPDGRIFIVDAMRRKIAVYSEDNTLLKEIDIKKLENPQGIALDNERSHIYVTDSTGYDVHAYDMDGKYLFKFESASGAPLGVAVNSEGTVFVSDQVGGRVAVYNPEGIFQYDIGELGDSWGNFARPKGIAIDSEDNIYVVDAAFSNFQIFNKKGRLLTFVGSVGTGMANLYLPVMIWIDQSDRIYVADRGNHRIQVYQYLSKKYYEEHPEEVPEEATPDEVQEEATPDEVQEEATPDEVQEEATPDEVPEEATPDEVPEEATPDEDEPSLSGWD